MHSTNESVVPRVLGELLRAPTPVPEPETARALARLLAARSDVAALLLHRVLVLETALQQLRGGGTAATGAGPAQAAADAVRPAQGTATQAAPAAPAAPRSVLRDAAAVALGVVAGQAVWDAVAADDTPGADTLGSALDGWLG